MSARPVVIVVAPTGGMQMPRPGVEVPITAEEISAEAARCRDAGAALVHVHARDENGRNTIKPEAFNEIIALIRQRTDILVQTTNGSGVTQDPSTGEWRWPNDDDRLGLLNLEQEPDVYGIAAGSADFWHPDGGYDFEVPYMNSPRYLKETISAVYGKGSTLEYEVTGLHVMDRLALYAEQGLLDRDQSNLWFTFGGGLCFSPADPERLVHAVSYTKRMFPNAIWGVLGAGLHQYTWPALALALDCDVIRVGMEDSLYLPDGSLARTNADIVSALVKVVEVFGRRPATPAEARVILGLDSVSE